MIGGDDLLNKAERRMSQRHLLTALNDTSAAVRNGWLLFLALMGYLVVALAGVTHEDLLLNTPVNLPMLNIGIALDRFFLFAPLFLLFVHVGMIVQHIVLARKAVALNDLILLEKRKDQGAGIRYATNCIPISSPKPLPVPRTVRCSRRS